MTGICMSISTASKVPLAKASTASAPFSTVVSSTPKGRRISWTTRRLTGWSSASRTRSEARRRVDAGVDDAAKFVSGSAAVGGVAGQGAIARQGQDDPEQAAASGLGLRLDLARPSSPPARG